MRRAEPSRAGTHIVYYYVPSHSGPSRTCPSHLISSHRCALHSFDPLLIHSFAFRPSPLIHRSPPSQIHDFRAPAPAPAPSRHCPCSCSIRSSLSIFAPAPVRFPLRVHVHLCPYPSSSPISNPNPDLVPCPSSTCPASCPCPCPTRHAAPRELSFAFSGSTSPPRAGPYRLVRYAPALLCFALAPLDSGSGSSSGFMSDVSYRVSPSAREEKIKKERTLPPRVVCLSVSASRERCTLRPGRRKSRPRAYDSIVQTFAHGMGAHQAIGLIERQGTVAVQNRHRWSIG